MISFLFVKFNLQCSMHLKEFRVLVLKDWSVAVQRYNNTNNIDKYNSGREEAWFLANIFCNYNSEHALDLSRH